jgi:SecD/SecF fusion protein
MQSSIRGRFLTCAAVLLFTTVLPWWWFHGVQGQPYGLKLGLDLKGGASITYRVTAPPGQDQAEILAEAIRVTQRRVDRMGVSEINLVESGQDQFTVELPGRGKEEIDRIKDIMRTVGSLEFRLVAPGERKEAETARRAREGDKYAAPAGLRWVPSEAGDGDYLLEIPEEPARVAHAAAVAALEGARKDGKPAAELAGLEAAVTAAASDLEKETAAWLFTGEDLSSATAERNLQGPGFLVAFALNPGRKAAFTDFTGNHVGRQMAIVLSGKVHTAPEIQSALPGSGQISSSWNPYTQATASELVTVLQSGSLRAVPEEISSFVVGPGLGDDAVRKGRLATAIAFGIVILFMAWLYKGAGWVANLALVLNLVMTLGLLMYLEAALSLPGIAGILLSVGMAVDANILVNERIREEKDSGKPLFQAVLAGYDRAFLTILDSNLTTIITAGVLYWVGTGPVRGFALTLALGLFLSMFTALYVTRTLFLWGIERGILTEFRMAPLAFKWAPSWMALRGPLVRTSIVLVVAGTAAFALRDFREKYDLEFTGGQRVVVTLKESRSLDSVRTALESSGIPGVSLRTVRGRDADAGDLDLAVESRTFEITARSANEAEGREFAARVTAALASDLVPADLTGLEITGEGADRAFKAEFHFETADLAATTVAEILGKAPIFPEPAALKIDPAPPIPGVTGFAVSGKTTAATDLEFREEVRRAVEARDGVDLSEPVPQSDFIGPGVAERLRDQAVLAIVLSILAQIAYLRFRFRDFTYGFAAAIALVHDVLITLGAVALCDGLGIAHVKINLPVIAAFLTLIGFSMNDTIVVFDRIRENLGRGILPDSALVDRSINQTLARSIRTSVTVFAVSLTLFIVNYGAASSLEGFAFVMTVGCVAGSYSTIVIAAPLLLFLPLYRKLLQGMGPAATLGLPAALGLGIAVATLTHGPASWVGMALAAALPGHFLYHLHRWLSDADPDATLKRLVAEEAAAARSTAAAEAR